MVTRHSPVTVLPGVGKVRAASYEKLGIQTLGDLITHYPRAYENRGEIREIANARTDGKTALILTVGTEPKVIRFRSHKSFLKFRAFDDSAICEITYFNQDYLKSYFPIGSVFRFWGKVEKVGKNYVMSSPIAEPWYPGGKLPPLCAIYRLTEGISLKQITKDVNLALELLGNEAGNLPDPLPPELLQKRGLMPLWKAEVHLHQPQDEADLQQARRRLVYQEFFDFSLGMSLSRKRAKQPTALPCPLADPGPLLNLLPYRLTGAQERVISDILRDMRGAVPMARMVVGDVGCGKTICAAAAMLFAVQNGYQAALMAPTEILARQHYQDLSELFGKLGIRVGLLIGAQSAAEKRKIRESLREESPEKQLQIVIGTHALLTEGVEFAKPGLVVTDEQHRFGALQRERLAQKSRNGHLLVMSATPIPRSLALILYGDLDVSRIDEMPPGRQQVDTFVVDETYRSRLDSFLQKQLDEGGQVYVVCPAVEEEEKEPDEVDFSDLFEPEKEPRPPLKAAVTYAKELAIRFPKTRVAFLHGKCKSAEKEKTMTAFARGEIGILVSTTVIEVGVNVPNASLMIVENAERFGLSQLHQLRGRVGRGTRKSYCILVMGTEAERMSEKTRERLMVMKQTRDGFAIAEKDLQQRGPGDFLITSADESARQSGELSFRLGNLASDYTLMTEASADANELAANDPGLAGHPGLLERIGTVESRNVIS